VADRKFSEFTVATDLEATDHLTGVDNSAPPADKNVIITVANFISNVLSGAIKLDDHAAPDDNTDLDATTSAHGLLPKLGGGTANFLRADGAWAAPPGGGVALPDATTAIYVAKSGSDANDGLNQGVPKLTIGAAITAAAALTPSSSNLVVVRVLDAGVYTEDLTMAAYVSVYAPSSKLVGSITHALNSSIVLAQHDMNGTYGCILNTAQSGAAYYSAEKVNVLSGFGWANINFGALLVDVKTSIVSAGAYLVQEASGQDGHLHYSGEDVYLDGAATGFWIQATGASIQVRVAHILQLGATTGGTGFLISNGSVVADVQTIGSSVAWNVSGGELDITAQEVTGAKTETGGTVDERLDIEGKVAAVSDISTWASVLDEDDMASDSATKVPTQQSTKAYADTKAPKYPARATKTAAATTDFELNGSAYTCQLSANITTLTASLPSGGNAATNEYGCRIDFTPPATGTFTATIPGTWEQAGPLDAISLSDTDVGILVILGTKADGTIVYTAQALA
jgi:hypothetical protein